MYWSHFLPLTVLSRSARYIAKACDKHTIEVVHVKIPAKVLGAEAAMQTMKEAR